MRRPLWLGILALCASTLACRASAQERVHQTLDVALDPATGAVSVKAEVAPSGDARDIEFLLHSRLRITNATPAVQEVPIGDVSWLADVEGSDAQSTPAVKRYRVLLPAAGPSFRLEYTGVFDFPLSDPQEEYTRGFRSTPGIVSTGGVYLPGASGWYPLIDHALMTFDLTVAQPASWRVVSEGAGTSRDADGRAHWVSTDPVDQIHIVGGPLHLASHSAGAVEAQVYLHEPDAALSSRYLAATAQYLEMYRSLIGPYPYQKFALVENFWETGYGMPSFTLLGPQVIRFPFILTSSYPHEILHNWWGNSVFVDQARGNWSEGLTAYLADHLMQEQRGEDAAYRRSTLQKYRDHVSSAQDFPLVQFRGRHSAATEAIGYGRTMIGFHTLRRAIGDDNFRKFVARFYRDFKGRRASFDDVRTTIEAVSGQQFGRFFSDWIERPGAPALTVTATVRKDGGYVVEGTIAQAQPGRPFAIDVPVLVQTTGKTIETKVALSGPNATFRIETADPPLMLHVDPAFDTFRRLDSRETPPSLGQLFGDAAPLVVIAANEDPGRAAAYRAMAEGWKGPAHEPRIVRDTDIATLPADRSVWLFGRDNRFAKDVADGRAVRLDATTATIDSQVMPLRDHAAVLVRRHPGNVAKAIAWIVADRADALPGLGRKLPHYGKYSYLGFEGAEPVNMLKGQWQASDSPLAVDLRVGPQRDTALAPLTVTRPPLATLPATVTLSQR